MHLRRKDTGTTQGRWGVWCSRSDSEQAVIGSGDGCLNTATSLALLLTITSLCFLTSSDSHYYTLTSSRVQKTSHVCRLRYPRSRNRKNTTATKRRSSWLLSRSCRQTSQHGSSRTRTSSTSVTIPTFLCRSWDIQAHDGQKLVQACMGQVQTWHAEGLDGWVYVGTCSAPAPGVLRI
jgi:hypothetical protein